VITKGLPVDCITRQDQSQLLSEIQVQVPEVLRVKVEPVKASTMRFTTMILYLRSKVAVMYLCKRGLI
jgi:hypothetical protein